MVSRQRAESFVNSLRFQLLSQGLKFPLLFRGQKGLFQTEHQFTFFVVHLFWGLGLFFSWFFYLIMFFFLMNTPALPLSSLQAHSPLFFPM